MYRAFVFVLAAVFLLLACGSPSAQGIVSTETATMPVTTTPVPATQPPTLAPATETLTAAPPTPTGWLGYFHILSPENWKLMFLLHTYPAEMPMKNSAVAIAPDGITMAMGASDRPELIFFDLESAHILLQTIYVNGVANPNAYFGTIEYLSDGTFIANSRDPDRIYHIDGSGQVLATWPGFEFAISADDRNVAFSTNAGTFLVDIANNKTLLTLSSPALGASFSPDHSKIALNIVRADEVSVEIWDITSRSLIKKLEGVGRAIYSPDGRFLVAERSSDVGDKVLEVFTPDGATHITTLNAGQTGSLETAMFSPDGAILAAQATRGPIAWDAASWQILESPAIEGRLYAFSPDGRFLITRTPDGGILFWCFAIVRG